MPENVSHATLKDEFHSLVKSHADNRVHKGVANDLAARRRENPGVLGDEWTPCILEPEGSSKEYRKNWARLIQKIYEIDPLTCPKCQGQMRIIAFIEDEEVIEKILKHLGLWEVKARPPPKVKAPSPTIYLDDSESQILSPDSFYAHPDYPMDSYVS